MRLLQSPSHPLDSLPVNLSSWLPTLNLCSGLGGPPTLAPTAPRCAVSCASRHIVCLATTARVGCRGSSCCRAGAAGYNTPSTRHKQWQASCLCFCREPHIAAARQRGRFNSALQRHVASSCSLLLSCNCHLVLLRLATPCCSRACSLLAALTAALDQGLDLDACDGLLVEVCFEGLAMHVQVG